MTVANGPQVRSKKLTYSHNTSQKSATIPSAATQEEDNATTSYLDSPNQLAVPIEKSKIGETRNTVLKQKFDKKPPGFDLEKLLYEMLATAWQ